MAKHRLGLGYGWFPMIAGTVWLVMVAWLLILWLKDGSPQYKQDDADVVYISDVGSIHLRIFRIGSCITAGFFILSLLTEFILRSRDRLPAFRQYRETLDSICALVFGTLASICLILLTFYNADRHKKTHWGLTLGFMICLSISCLFTAGEYQRLRRDHFQKRGLRRSFILKVTVIVLSICLAIAMIVLMYTCRNYWSATEPTGHCNRVHSASAICEWVIALLFGIYLFTLVMDLRPSAYTARSSTAAMEAGYTTGANARWAHRDSAGTLPVRQPAYVAGGRYGPEGLYTQPMVGGYPQDGYGRGPSGYPQEPYGRGVGGYSSAGRDGYTRNEYPSASFARDGYGRDGYATDGYAREPYVPTAGEGYNSAGYY